MKISAAFFGEPFALARKLRDRLTGWRKNRRVRKYCLKLFSEFCKQMWFIKKMIGDKRQSYCLLGLSKAKEARVSYWSPWSLSRRE